MNQPLKTAPRFVPTLTEVVDPMTFGQAPSQTHEPTVDELVERVSRLVQGDLERRVEQTLYRLVAELIAQRWTTVSGDLTDDINDLITQRVREALVPPSGGKS